MTKTVVPTPTEQLVAYLTDIGVDPAGCNIRTNVDCPGCHKATATAEIWVDADHDTIRGCADCIGWLAFGVPVF